MYSLVRTALLASASLVATAACGSGALSATTGDGGNGGDGGGAQHGAGGAGAADMTSTTSATGTPAKPIEAPEKTWTWVPFEDAHCANGSPTGIGVSLSSTSSHVLIYMMGGGACWNELTCYVLKSAVNIESGFGATEFDAVAPYLNGSLFDRNDPDNPLADASFVLVPYCTGDLHAGANAQAEYGGKKTLHVGFQNMAAYLSRLSATFPTANHVLLSGSSAGGFGATFNWIATSEAFAAARVDLLDDSGPPLPPPYLSESLEGQWRAAWNLNATLPSDCAECMTDISALVDYHAMKMPNSRSGLLSFTQDGVIGQYLGISGAQVEEGLSVLAGAMAQYPNTKFYYTTGTDHVLLGKEQDISQNGVSLKKWIAALWTDDPTWDSVKP